MRGKDHLKNVLVQCGLSAEDVNRTVETLGHECPWFGGEEEVSEDIGIEMLTDVLPARLTSLASASMLVDWHNENARGNQSSVAADNDAYASLVHLVGNFGKEDGLGSGDFWVMEDLLSNTSATVMSFNPMPLPMGMEKALLGWLNQQQVMKKLTLVNREGDALLELSRV